MEKRNLNEEQTDTQRKEPYEPPKATFIALKIEERLMACLKQAGEGGACKNPPSQS